MSNSIVVTVPATTANMGAGFDCLGMALSLENRFEFTAGQGDKTTFTVISDTDKPINLPDDNLLHEAYLRFFQSLNIPAPIVDIKIIVNVPFSRGLGSSATAIVAGVLGANHFSPKKLSSTELLNLAIEIEGHPDNVVPAMLGNCILSVAGEQKWHLVPITCNPDIKFIVAIPDFKLSTEEARSVLPSNLSYSDAVFNISHLSLLLKGLETGNTEWLTEALKDKLHQPYRTKLIKGYDRIYDNVINAGGYGMVISGAGPTLLAMSNASVESDVITTMKQTWESFGVKPIVKSLDIQTEGAKVFQD